MSDNLQSLSKSFYLLNKVLNTLVRKNYGNQYSVRLNSLRFIENRTNVYYFHTCSEKIIFKSIKPVTIDEVIVMKEFIIFTINSLITCIDTSINMEVIDVEILIV